MPMTSVELILRWSVRLAVGCYFARVLLDVRRPLPSEVGPTRTWARRFWTIGCLLYLVHVIAAFGGVHHWSHAQAYRHTAMTTAATTGIAWGGGLYVNYAFSLVWMVDVAAWWIRGVDFPYRHVVYSRAVQSLFAFMMINATVVFGPRFWIPLAVFVAFPLLLLAYRQRLGQGTGA